VATSISVSVNPARDRQPGIGGQCSAVWANRQGDGGRGLPVTVNGRPTDISSVRANIERVVAESPNSALIIQAHPKAKSGVVVQIRDEAYNAGFTDRVNILITQT
jgi:hypothetical protein